jgi:glyoxylase-like metal-dependent hydrolase (beta-lactamase superfamily II)
MKQIAPRVYVEEGYRGVTVGCIITSAGPVCIDSPMLPADARDWRTRLARLSDRPVRLVVLTDACRERVMGLQYLGGTVVAHDAAWDRLKGLGESFRHAPDGRAADAVAPCRPQVAAQVASDLRLVLPEITFSRRLVIHDPDAPIVLQAVGGPTPGSLWAHLPRQNVLFTGDLVTPGAHPLTAEADFETWLETLERIQSGEFAVKTIVPGRSGPCNKAALAPQADYLRAMHTRVLALVRSRQPRAETTQLAAEFLGRFPVPAQDRDCVQRRIKAGLDRLYDTLKANK